MLAFLLAALTATAAPPSAPAADKPGELEKLKGKWTTTRPWHRADGRTASVEVQLEIADGALTFCTIEDGKTKSGDFALELVRAEDGEGAPRMVLRGNKKESVVYYDADRDRLVLVGRAPLSRPFEGFSLSGGYARQPK